MTERNLQVKISKKLLHPHPVCRGRSFWRAQGMSAVAERAGIPRESLYRALGPKGNPTVKTLLAILNASGLHLSVTRQVAA